MVYLKINDTFRFFLAECLHVEIILYINFVFFFSLIIKLWTICHSIRNFMHIVLMVPLVCFLKIYLPILIVGQSSFSLFYCGWISFWTHTRYLFYAKSCCEENRHPFPARFQPSRQGSYQEKKWNLEWGMTNRARTIGHSGCWLMTDCQRWQYRVKVHPCFDCTAKLLSHKCTRASISFPSHPN